MLYNLVYKSCELQCNKKHHFQSREVGEAMQVYRSLLQHFTQYLRQLKEIVEIYQREWMWEIRKTDFEHYN